MSENTRNLLVLCLLALINCTQAIGADVDKMVLDPTSHSSSKKASLRTRKLEFLSEYEAEVFLELQFVNDATASELKTRRSENSAVAHFCSCVHGQFTGSAVVQAAYDLNATISIPETEPLCQINATSRIFDPEAESIFGDGHLSLQVQVLKDVSVTSSHLLWQDIVDEVVGAGFEVATGGQRNFLNCLQASEEYHSLLFVELRRGLSPEQLLPTPTPTTIPTALPTQIPTALPTRSPSIPPTTRPTASPSWMPSFSPSQDFSNNPSSHPSTHPSIAPSPTSPSLSTVPANGSAPTANGAGADPYHGSDSPMDDPLVIAAIVGVAISMLTLCLVVYVWWQRRQKTGTNRKHPRHALTSRDGQSSYDGVGIVPGVVELDQRSLAETSLGEQTAGRAPSYKKRRSPTQAIRPLDSFDENSLYTTPFSVKHDDVSSYVPGMSIPSNFSGQFSRPPDFEGNILFPQSDSTTTGSSDGISFSGPPSGRTFVDDGAIESDTGVEDIEVARIVGPIDLDTGSPYELKRETGNLAYLSGDYGRTKQTPQGRDDASSDLNTSEIETWSCDFEDFSLTSSDIQDQTRTAPASQSSKSTTKVNNIKSVLGKLRSPEEKMCDPPGYTREERESMQDESESQLDGEANGTKDTLETMGSDSADLTSEHDGQGSDKPLSPSSESSRKSLSSRRSTTSWSSWGSRKTNTGQPPRQPKKSETEAVSDDAGNSKEANSSTLSKLLDSVTLPDESMSGPQGHPIPAVTPEEDESENSQTRSKDDDSTTLLGLQFKDDFSASSASTGRSPSPWLFEKVEESLGPKSVTADMESLSGKSHVKSPTTRSRTGAESTASFSSHFSFQSGFTHNEIAFTPNTVEHDLKRLEKQLAALDSDHLSTSSVGVSSITGGSLATSVSSRNRRAPKISRKKRIVVMVPPGRLGVILANRHDGKGTVVSEIRETSPLVRMLSPGDKLVAVDEEDVTGMVVSQITSLMASKADRERRLTVVTSISQQHAK